MIGTSLQHVISNLGRIFLAQAEPPGQLPLPFPEDNPNKPPNPFEANAWVDTNRVSSDGKTKVVILKGLPKGAKELDGEWVKVDGQTHLEGVFKHDPFPTAPKQPPEPQEPPPDYPGEVYPARKRKPDKPDQPRPKSTVTTDGFDQVELYKSLTDFKNFYNRLGFDMKKIIKESKNGRMVAHANATPDMNAWFSPQDEEQTYGTSDDNWHLAEDGDVTHHEPGHFTIYRITPGLLGWQSNEGTAARGGREGGAIHEGLADLGSVGIANDAEVSEDFPPAMGEPDDKNKGLRTADNDLTLSQAGTEVHDRGRVYLAFSWSLKEKLSDPNGPYRLSSRKAADTAAKIGLNDIYSLATNAPRPEDFVKAALAGTEALAKEGRLPKGVALADLKKDIIAEAIRREMIKSESEVEKNDIVAAGDGFNVEAVKKSLAANDSVFFSKEPDQSSSGIGVKRDFYQEWVKLADGDVAKVLGGGFFVFRDAAGAVYGYSKLDVVTELPPKPAQKFNLHQGFKTAQDAIVIARSQAQKEFDRTKKELDQVKGRMPLKAGGDEFKTLKEAWKKFHIAEAAKEKAKHLSQKDAQLVVIPGQQDPHYELRMGLSLYYVNTQSGKMMIKEDVVWD